MRRIALKVSGGLMTLLTLSLALVIWAGPAHATGTFPDVFVAKYGSTGTQSAGCKICHTSAPALNPYGMALLTAGATADDDASLNAAFPAAEGADSDGAGGTNLAEIQAGAQPGWCVATTPGCSNASGTPPGGLLDPAPVAVNHPPVAIAGPDQAVTVGQTVQLDGRNSTDPDTGTTLTYAWTLSKPAGSAAALSSAAAVQPTFVADVAGDYTAQLTVSDGALSSAADTIVITAAPASNLPPVANAGPDQAVGVGQMATLNGSASTDPEAHALTYAWSFVSKPAGSAAALSDAAAVQPTFTADQAGSYTAQLIVNDGTQDSPADTVIVSAAAGNVAPTANAGPDQAVGVGQTITLNGSGSSDPEGSPLTYTWSFVSKPAGSAAALSDAAAVQPTFVADVAGDFVVQLIVNDGTTSSAPDTVIVAASSGNLRPTANAGSAQTVTRGAAVTLNGSGSSDPEGSPLTYTWSFVSRPAGSVAALSDPAAVQPTFVADVAGDYVVGLVVSDGTLSSTNPANVTVTAQSPGGGLPGGGPGGTVDFGIGRFRVTREVELRELESVRPRVVVQNAGQAAGDVAITLVGVQNGTEVYRQRITLGAPAGQRAWGRFPGYRPTAAGDIAWTVTIQDQTPDNNSATAVTKVKGRDRNHDRDHERRLAPREEEEDED